MAQLWQAARQQVSEFEQRSAELGLALSTEKAALEAVEKEVTKLEQERAAFAKQAQEAEGRKVAAAAQLAELRAAATKAAKDSSMIHKHLELLRSSQREASQQMETDRQRYEQHLAHLRAQLAAFAAHLGGGGEGTAAGPAPMVA